MRSSRDFFGADESVGTCPSGLIVVDADRGCLGCRRAIQPMSFGAFAGVSSSPGVEYGFVETLDESGVFGPGSSWRGPAYDLEVAYDCRGVDPAMNGHMGCVDHTFVVLCIAFAPCAVGVRLVPGDLRGPDRVDRRSRSRSGCRANEPDRRGAVVRAIQRRIALRQRHR